ncbi:MAG: glycosyltransferase family 4 protein, partial [Planctomycetota bacterium]
MSEQLRVAVVLAKFEPARGGTERYASELVRRLRARGHDVIVVAETADEDALHGAPLWKVECNYVAKAQRVWHFAQKAHAMTKEGFDIVHGLQKSIGHTVFQPHTGSHRASLEGKRNSKRGLARAFHGVGKLLSWKQWVFAKIERLQYAQNPAPVYLAISPLVRKQMHEMHGLRPDQIRVLPNPVDGERFTPADDEAKAAARAALGIAPSEGQRVGLWVGKERRLKGLPALLQAWATVPDLLLVAGPEPMTPPAAARDRVKFLGPVKDVTQAYAAADALLLPTFYDPAPLVVLEALASRLPVLTTEACGHSDLARG